MSGLESPADSEQPIPGPGDGVGTGTGPGLGNSVGTVVLFLALIVAAFIAYFASAFFVMGTDTCLARCDTTALTQGMFVTRGGIVLAVVLAVGGSIRAALHERPTWPWPLLGLVLVPLTFFIGGSLAQTVK